MKRMRILTVVTALVMIIIYGMISLIGIKEEQKKSRSIKVGFVYDGDESTPYTNNFFKVQKKIEENDFGGRVVTVCKENVSEEKGEQAIQELIEEGCDLIFTTSYGYQKAAKKLAAQNPQIQFCQATGDNANTDPLPNYHTFMGEIYEGRYVSGVVAGMKLRELIQNGVIAEDEAKLGYVGAFPYAEVISGYTAFLLGVRSIVPSAVMEVRYTNTWSSYTLEKLCAEKLIADGCVIISQHSDTFGPAVACENAMDHGRAVYHVGYNQSMIDMAPTTSLVSTKIDWSVYILAAVNALLHEETIEKSMDGNIHGNDIGAGFKYGWVQIVDINDLIVPEGTRALVNETIEKLKKKQIVVFQGDYVGIDPMNPDDRIDLQNGYEENKNASAPSFYYILQDVVQIVED